MQFGLKYSALFIVGLVAAIVYAAVRDRTPAAPLNPSFETGDLAGWTVVSGTAFSDHSVTTANHWGWGGPFRSAGAHHLWGARPTGDNATGELHSSSFRLRAPGRVALRVGGGEDARRTYVAITRASDGRELFRTTGLQNEAYRCVGWDGSRHVGERLFIKVVDRATGGWGHINLDGVDTVHGTCARGATPHYAADPYRPQFHFSARRGWINDPNGMVRWRGQYHLFYQHNPRAPVFGPMHWGHAVSDDLVRWRHLPIALAPKPTDIPGDLSGVFSGNAVDHDGALNLFYTDFTDKTKHPEATAETVALATSRDGRRFDADPSRPLIPAAPESAGAGWRDPYVVKEPDGSYLMVVGAGDARTGSGNVQLYRSRDLRSWEYHGVLFEGDGSNGKMWECPNLFRLGDKWVLLVSVNDSGLQKVIYFVGTMDGDRFRPETSGDLDLGSDHYATQTFEDAAGRRIALSWMNRWGGAMPERLDGWSGAMTVPRELFLLDDGRLGSRPVRALEGLRGKPLAQVHGVVVDPDTTGLLREVRGDVLEVVASFDAARATARTFGLTVRRSPNGSEQTRIVYDRAAQTVMIDRTRSGIGDRSVVGGRIEPAGDGTVRLRVLLDRSSVEVFANDRSAITARIHPNYRESTGIDVFAEDGAVPLTALEAWPLRSAW